MHNHEHEHNHCEGQVQRLRGGWETLPPELTKSGLTTSLVTIKFPESGEKQYRGQVNIRERESKVAYHCSNDRRPPCL